MTSQSLAKLKLPDSSGVYIFRDAQKRPFYIGRATSLRDRVKSYFGADLIVTRGPRIIDMVTRSRMLSFQKTDSVLEAILLENELIKKYQPYYNIAERDDKSSQYVIITDELWPRVFLARARDVDQALKDGNLPYKIKRRFGPYPEGGLMKDALKILRKLFPFKDKKSFDARHDNFYRAIGRSPAENDENARRRYLRTIDRLVLFFEGKKDLLRKRLTKDMKTFAKELRFEEAGQAKRLLYALEHINDMALIKVKGQRLNVEGENVYSDFRIEAYDIAHLSGTNVVGAMVASVGGEFAPNEYRKFKISRQANNDIAGLTEIIYRRLNHSEWTYPDLIVVDGNKVQANAAESVLKSRRITIAVVAVTKDAKHKAASFVGHPDLIEKYGKEIVAINVEAHRFAIKFHRYRRGKLV